MRLTPRRALAPYLVCGVCVAGIQVAATLAASDAALAATSSQCQPLPWAATPSPTSIQPELCVSVQASQSGITTGHAASYTVQVWATNGSASGVTVTLTGSPSGFEPDFTGRCPSGDGSATCTIGALATSLAPSTYQMQAQIPVAAGASVTSVTLTATADATTSPAMSVLPSAAEAVAVSAPAPAAASRPPASTRPASTSPASTPPSSTSPATLPAVAPGAVTSTLGSATAAPSSASTSPINPVAGILPVSPTPAAATVPISAAVTGTPSASSFTLVITAGTAELAGALVLGLVLLLVGTRLVRRRLAVRGDAEEHGGTGTKQRRFWPLWPPSRWRAARREGKPGEATGALAQDGDSVSVHSGADQGAERQS